MAGIRARAPFVYSERSNHPPVVVKNPAGCEPIGWAKGSVYKGLFGGEVAATDCSDDVHVGSEFPPQQQLSCHYVESFFGDRLARDLMARAGLLDAGGNLPKRVSKVDFWNLCLDNLSINNDETHGCTRQPLPLSTWGLTFSAVNQMDSVKRGLKRFAELAPLIPAGVVVRVNRKPDRVMVTFDTVDEPVERSERYLEVLAISFHCFLRWGVGRELDLEEVRLSSLLDDVDGTLFDGLAADIERYGTGLTISYDAATLDWPLGVRKYQVPSRHETVMLLEVLEAAGPSASTRRSQLITDLRQYLFRGALSQQQAADRMGVSVATLQRRLARAGTNFREVSREARIERLVSLLRTPNNLDDIAVDLGFSERRSLCRACKQWLGMTPTEFRSKNYQQTAPNRHEA